ncbi:hypothetical protein OBBRIDRAFT_796287 [Obba rivulosa]|uniref:Uncharacterized protein n=1 Tax=Obba rivulosa TaxID=1052685 RepID=A0A8E2DLY4_9APHY|nr:hypothetical protein OBBRIDRAFT_796287 [Obba rivulosa]
MSAYYPDRRYPLPFHATHHVFSAAPPVDNALANIDPNTVNPGPVDPTAGAPTIHNGMTDVVPEPVSGEPSRRCSVRGCQAVLPPGYGLKMCESCRGRHRVYATTKRQKRKMEKAALGAQVAAQGLAWMPQDDEQEQPRHGQCILEVASRQKTRAVEALHPAPVAAPTHPPVPPSHSPPIHASSPYSYTPSTWDQSALDPRLFSHPMPTISTTHTAPPPHTAHSELANALTLPLPPPPSNSVSVSPGAPSSQRTPSPVPMLVPVPTEPITEGGREEDALPPRYCSIKGCKALVSGSSFFKMCQPCRDRYRSYGTTKRAKWRREKDKAVAAMKKSGEDSAGEGSDQGADQSTPGADGDPMNPQLPPRMCTVSHCRAVLLGTYPYLRCERHRVQNRHHSRLKRVRDKESKAQAWDEWNAAVSTSASGIVQEPSFDERQSYSMGPEEQDEHEQTHGIIDSTASPAGAPQAGVPPAARGTRRTNHVCSIRACSNLLSPSTPWKMCDECRARDRATRKDKASRRASKGEDAEKEPSGEGEDEGETEVQISQDGQDMGQTMQDAAPTQDIPQTAPSQAPAIEPGPATGELPSDLQTNLIFMDPILSESPQHISSPRPTTTVQDAPETAGASNGKKRASRRKDKTKASTENEKQTRIDPEFSTSTASTSTSRPPATAPSSGPPTTDTPQPYGAHMPPPYPMPYYMHHPYMPPYPGGNPSQYTYAPPYPPRPYVPGAYQAPPFPPYAQPYAYPPQPFTAPYSAQQYAAPAAPAPPPPPPPQPVYTASFVARTDYGDAPFSPPESAPTTYYATFSARTGEDCTAPPRAPRRRAVVNFNRHSGPNKRLREDIDAGASVSPPPMASLMAPSAASSDDALQHGTSLAGPEGMDSVNASQLDDSSGGNASSSTCTNPSCHRTVTPQTVGSLCARCKERLRKKQAKAKQRFRLEPRALLGRGAGHHALEGTPRSDSEDRDV